MTFFLAKFGYVIVGIIVAAKANTEEMMA